MRPRCCPTGSMPPVASARRHRPVAHETFESWRQASRVSRRGRWQGEAIPGVATAAAFARSDWERLPGSIVGLLWHVITPALDESIHLYTIAQYMNVQPLAPLLSFEEQWFRLLYEALGRIWGHA